MQKLRCGLCDRDYEIPAELHPYIDARSKKPVCGDCIRSIIHETWGKNGVLGK